MDKSKKESLMVCPGGTSNDFASLWWSFGKCDLQKAFDSIEKYSVYDIDVGKVNISFFLNVAGAGIFTDVTSETPAQMKQKLGTFAYWIEGMERISEYEPLQLTIKVNGKAETLQCYLYLDLNSKGAGGLKSLAPKAQRDDGYIDCVTVKKPLSELIKFGKTDLSIFALYTDVDIVIDGEKGPSLPVKIDIYKQFVPFFHE